MPAGIINVTIVLIGIFIALAVVCSWIQEQIVSILKLRGTTLKAGLAKLMSDDAETLDAVTDHPLIKAACKTDESFPSYIEPRNFALAFWQTVKTSAAVSSAASTTFADVSTAVEAWNPQSEATKRVKKSAVALLTEAQGDYDKLLGATDAWFDAQMDRVSGWYKTNAQWMLLIIAFVLCFGLGVDTLDIGRQLFVAPDISQATSNAITSAVQSNANNQQAGANAVATAISNSQQLENLRLLRWWIPAAGGTPVGPAVPTPPLLLGLFGMLLSTVAVSLGAPFWFDLLNGIVNVRMAGNKPDPVPSPSSDGSD